MLKKTDDNYLTFVEGKSLWNLVKNFDKIRLIITWKLADMCERSKLLRITRVRSIFWHFCKGKEWLWKKSGQEFKRDPFDNCLKIADIGETRGLHESVQCFIHENLRILSNSWQDFFWFMFLNFFFLLFYGHALGLSERELGFLWELSKCFEE